MKNKFIASGIFALAFIVLIVLVSAWNVSPIGPSGTSIGLSLINKATHEALGVSETWYEITEILGYLAIAVAGAFAVFGIEQAIKRKGLLKVDKKLFALVGLYVLMAAFYVLFEIVVVNYRPIIMSGECCVEPSFPSSHTMLVCVIMGGAFVLLNYYIKNRGLRIALQYACLFVAAITAIGRLLSGVHWLTDIIGGVLLSLALISLFADVCTIIDEKK